MIYFYKINLGIGFSICWVTDPLAGPLVALGILRGLRKFNLSDFEGV